MPQVTVTINGHPHVVQCDAGQEPRIREMARLVEDKVAGFAGQSQRAGETRLLVLAALVLADELSEATENLRRASARETSAADDPALADGIDRLASRIEAVASRLETSHI